MSEHDPLCSMWSKVVAGDRCDCAVIAKVRADMLAKALDAVGNATYGFRGTYHYIVDETVETALAALRGLHEGGQ